MKKLILIFILMLVATQIAIAIDISGCASLDTPGATYDLTADIKNSTTSKCINFTADDVTLDCHGHLIDGDDLADYGVYISRPSVGNITNITIRGCVVEDWDSGGILFHHADRNNIYNSSINSNDYGIELRNSSGNTIENTSFNSNRYDIDSEDDGKTINNTINNCTFQDTDSDSLYSITFYYSSNNTKITNSRFDKTGGIYIETGYNIIFKNNVLHDLDDAIEYDSIINGVIANNTINGSLSGFGGMKIDYSTRIVIENNTLTQNSGHGNIQIYYTNNTKIRNNTLDNATSTDGIHITEGGNNTIIGNLIRSNPQDGITLYDTKENTITNNTITNNSGSGIHNYQGVNNSIYNNFFNQTINTLFESTVYHNNWNISNRTGTRIFSPGTQIGGNYWANPDGTGYSETCNDLDGDDFCDDAYTLNTSNIDYRPLTGNLPRTVYQCGDITQSGTYNMTTDIKNATDNWCINITANNVVLDCQGHLIDGDDTGVLISGRYYDYGIWIWRNIGTSANITIKNCSFTGWSAAAIRTLKAHNISMNHLNFDGEDKGHSGISLWSDLPPYEPPIHNILIANSSFYRTDTAIVMAKVIDLQIINNTFRNNGYAIYDDVASNNTLIKDNRMVNSSNDGYAISTYYDGNWTIRNNIIENGIYTGLYLYYSGYPPMLPFTVVNNTIRNNGDNGIEILDDVGAIIANNTIVNNSGYGIDAFRDGINMTIYNNLFNNTDNILIDSSSTGNNWNITNRTGTRIAIPAFPQIAGNYWATPTGTGYSEICNDTDGDGFCDESYTLTTNNADYKALSNYNQPFSDNVSITPSPALTTNNLACTYDYANNGSPEEGLNWTRWYINDRLNETTQMMLGSGNFTDGDNISCSKMVAANYSLASTFINDTQWRNSSTLTIGDSTPPVLSNTTLSRISSYTDEESIIFVNCTEETGNFESGYPKVSFLDPNSNVIGNYTMTPIYGTTVIFHRNYTFGTAGTYTNFSFYCQDQSGNLAENVSVNNSLSFVAITRTPPTGGETPGGGGGGITYINVTTGISYIIRFFLSPIVLSPSQLLSMMPNDDFFRNLRIKSEESFPIDIYASITCTNLTYDICAREICNLSHTNFTLIPNGEIPVKVYCKVPDDAEIGGMVVGNIEVIGCESNTTASKCQLKMARIEFEIAPTLFSGAAGVFALQSKGFLAYPLICINKDYCEDVRFCIGLEGEEINLKDFGGEKEFVLFRCLEIWMVLIPFMVLFSTILIYIFFSSRNLRKKAQVEGFLGFLGFFLSFILIILVVV